MSRPAAPRVPWADLDRLIRAATGRRWATAADRVDGTRPSDWLLTTDAVAAHIGVTSRTVVRWRQAGTVPLHEFDRAAIAYGYHPAEVAPELWTDVA